MVELRLAPDTAARLARYLETAGTAAARRTEHWHHFGGLNSLRVDAARGIVAFQAGAGFDSEYELSFRPYRLREIAASLLRRSGRRDPTTEFRRAFESLHPAAPGLSLTAGAAVLGAPLTAHKTLAIHYANLLLPHLVGGRAWSCLEIGAGSGYLAALIRHLRPGRLVIVDLPEILPFSFLTLNRIFPDAPFRLPHETGNFDADPADRCMYFLTADQAASIPSGSVDLAVNTASFGEMLPEQIAAYFALLRRCARADGLFFTSNRVEKWMKRPAADADPIAIRFEDYPWLPGDRDVFYGLSDFHARVQPENPVYSRLCRLTQQPVRQ
jgi:SAM-dependent methyltransferase